MKTTIDYTRLEGQAKIDKAVQDCKEYINSDTAWHNVEKYCRQCTSLEQVQQGLGMFLGIEGYPAVAMWETYGNYTTCGCVEEANCTCNAKDNKETSNEEK